MEIEERLEEIKKNLFNKIDDIFDTIFSDAWLNIDQFEKQYTKAINHINFKAIIAEQVGWDGFKELSTKSEKHLKMVEIL